ncbi:hypothetical protein [Silvibacterium sp.]|uniref:hypothetical protein n=1 Tax=Silvibacterium sp. TaxID=1964179 RepID=UPI0039E6B67B
MKRRSFLQTLGATMAAAAIPADSFAASAWDSGSPIDRKALVERHVVVLQKPDSLSPLSVGNGELGFTADVTGLQTFPAFHAPGMPLHTMAQWAWHESPNPHGYTLSETMEMYDSHGRSVPYPSNDQSPAGEWLMRNPHRFDLGRLALCCRR